MANNVQHLLDVVEVDNTQARDALRAVLHTILFTRALGHVEPGQVTPTNFPNLSYATCGDSGIDKSVEDAIDTFLASLQLVGPDLVRGELVLSFYDTRKRAGFLGIGAAKEDKVHWERWVIPMIVNRGSLKTVSAESALQSNLFRILHLANDLSHVPKLRGEEGSIVYKYEMLVSQNPTDKGVFKQILAHSPSSLRFNMT